MAVALLAVHAIAAIVLIGPITAAASVFPRYARGAVRGDAGDRSVAAAMHRISRGYAIPALAVPVFGIGTAAALDVLGQVWLLVAMALTAAAGVLLAAGIVPGQRRLLEDLGTVGGGDADPPGAPRQPGEDLLHAASRLGAMAGVFASTWTVVVVLMIVRPGSTTGV